MLLSVCFALLGGCVTTPPPPPYRFADPSDPAAPETSTKPLRANLVATTKVYLDPSLGREAQKMEHGNMQGMDHSKVPGMASPPQDKQALEKETKKTSNETKKTSDEMKQKAQERKPNAVIYTCVMHPEVTSDKQGNCPKCRMKLVPKSANQ